MYKNTLAVVCRTLWIFLFLVSGCAPRLVDREEGATARFRLKGPEDIALVTPSYPPATVLNKLIVIDAGHGGEDRGTISLSNPPYQEKSLTLTTSRFVRDYLRGMGYQIQMTRSDDTFLPPLSRAVLANEVQPALFVSIHYNSAPNPEAHGIEVFYHESEKNPKRSKTSKALAAMVLDRVIEETQAKSRGVKTGNFAVIRETAMPAILVEGGFLTNQEEMNLIKNPGYIKRIAWGIAKGIDHYIRTSSRTQ